MDGECNDSPRGKTADGEVDRLYTNGKSKPWVEINLCNSPRKVRERDNVLHGRPQMNLVWPGVQARIRAGSDRRRTALARVR